MSDILYMEQSRRKELDRIEARTKKLEPLLGLERDERGMSLNKAALTNDFASRRLDQIRACHPVEWEEYCDLVVQEMELMDELGITDAIMDELFPDEQDLDIDAALKEKPFRVLK